METEAELICSARSCQVCSAMFRKQMLAKQQMKHRVKKCMGGGENLAWHAEGDTRTPPEPSPSRVLLPLLYSELKGSLGGKTGQV